MPIEEKKIKIFFFENYSIHWKKSRGFPTRKFVDFRNRTRKFIDFCNRTRKFIDFRNRSRKLNNVSGPGNLTMLVSGPGNYRLALSQGQETNRILFSLILAIQLLKYSKIAFFRPLGWS